MDWAYVQQLPCPVYYQQFVAALAEGEIAGEQGLWWDKEKFSTVRAKGLILYTGPDGSNQNLLAASGSYDSSGYQHTALVAASNTAQLRCFTGTQSELPDIAVEVIGLKFGASTPDASPADIVNDILTSYRRGAHGPPPAWTRRSRAPGRATTASTATRPASASRCCSTPSGRRSR
jgi:hypothetical protein